MKISVALCTYNGEQYIEHQINSIVNQTVPVDEIVICDDQSNDATQAKIKLLQERIQQIKLVVNEKNLNTTKNFEKAISICTGDYIFLADQDDYWQPNKVAQTLDIFATNPNAEGVFSNANLMDSQDRVFSNKTIWEAVFFFEKELKKPIDLFDYMTKNGNVVTGATLCIKKEIKAFIFPFSEHTLHDEWIATLLALRNTLYYSTENLIAYRIHAQQQVGMKNLSKIEKKTKMKRILLGLNPPKSFNDYQILFKKICSKYKLLHTLKQNPIAGVDFDLQIKNCKIELEGHLHKMTNKYPLRSRIMCAIDRILGKRKLV